MHHRFEWDDLRLFLAVQRAGSIRSAAEALKINHSTVSRRLSRMRQSSPSPLFETRARKLVLTDAGEKLFEIALRIEQEVLGAERLLIGKSKTLEGRVRLSLPAVLLPIVVTSLETFRLDHEKLDVEFLTGISLADLTRREADIALRFTETPPENYFGRRLGHIKINPYRRRGHETSSWVQWSSKHLALPPAKWVQDNIEKERRRLCFDSAAGVREAIRNRLGCGYLIEWAADESLEIVAEAPNFDTAFWILTHQDLSESAAVRAVMKHLSNVFEEKLSAEKA